MNHLVTPSHSKTRHAHLKEASQIDSHVGIDLVRSILLRRVELEQDVRKVELLDERFADLIPLCVL